MELALNLVWAIAAFSLLGMVYPGVRRGTTRISARSAMMVAVLICFILLPVISISDDLLNARQAALPLSGQTLRLASEGISSGLDNLVVMGLYQMLLMCFLIEAHAACQDRGFARPLAGWLARSQRLRPPPYAA